MLSTILNTKLSFYGVDISDLPLTWFYFSWCYPVPSIFDLMVGKQQLYILNVDIT